ncbi:MAG: transposase [Opitutaceae bacterium]|nr:transposase [Opitutaceae bacterium]
MARKLRLEYEGAVYHIINRGNYRAAIFRDDGAKLAFLACLDEACTKARWQVHAWCIMSNHYHLALETPTANLVAGMQWLQGTFATRFNRYRHECGHLFQGRYKSIVVDPGAALGPLCHYIHLNPVRAGLTTVDRLGEWAWSSFRWLLHPKERTGWLRTEASLGHAGGLADTDAGRRKYAEYLAWLSAETTEKKRLGFERMARGWVLGTRAFKQELIAQHREAATSLERGELDLAEARLAQLDERFAKLLAAAGKTPSDVARDPKSAEWKVAMAAEMKRTTTATNQWLAQALAMGSPFTVSRLAGGYAGRWSVVGSR